MNQTYIVADLALFDSARAAEILMSVDTYNSIAIESINKVADSTDTIMFFGKLTAGELEETRNLLNQIKARKVMVDRDENFDFTRIEDLGRLGFAHLWSIGGYCSGEVDNTFYEVYIVPLKRDMQLALDQRNKGYYIVTTTSKLSEDLDIKSYDNKVLNIDFHNWGLKPWSYTQILETIDKYTKEENK